MSMQGIFFDLYGTLLVYGNMTQAWSDWLSTFYNLLKNHGLNLPKDSFALECDGFFSNAGPTQDQNRLTALERRIQSLGRRLNLELDEDHLRPIADRIAGAWQRHISIDPAAIDVLSALGQDKKIGLVSNFDHPRHVRNLLRHYGIESYFDTIIISSEVGVRKPDPAIFSFALEQTGLSHTQVAYVGDTHEDVNGAIAAGIHPIFIARPANGTNSDALDFQVTYRGEDLSGHLSANHEVTVISSLPEVLDITAL